jgi:hypothetical protein
LPEISFAFPCDNSISAVVTQVADALRVSHYEVLCKGVVDELATLTKILQVWAKADDPSYEAQSKKLSASAQAVLSALLRAEGTSVSDDKIVTEVKATQTCIAQWLWANADHELRNAMYDIAVKLDGVLPSILSTPPGRDQFGIVIKVNDALARCGSADDVLEKASKGIDADFLALRSLIVELKVTKLDDMCDKSLVKELIGACDKLIDVVATKQLDMHEESLSTELHELETMLDSANTEDGDDWDVGLSKLHWKAAAQLTYARLDGKDVVDPKALDEKVAAVRARLASYKGHVASFGVERATADELSASVGNLCQQAIKMIISGALSALLLEKAPDKVVLFRGIRKQLKRLKDENIAGVHAGLVTQATKAASVS